MHKQAQPSRPVGRLVAVTALLSAAVLGYQIGLMRLLLVASWHHFAFLVISIALLGFGASGTALTLLRGWVMRRPGAVLAGLTAATALSMVLCTQLAQHVPIQARFVPSLWARHVGGWLLYWLLLFIPFFFGAAGIGLGLMIAGRRVPAAYAANLAGSGVGALAMPLLMWWVAPAWLAVAAAVPAWCATLACPWLRGRSRGLLAAAGLLLIGGALALDPPHIRSDPHKMLAQIQRLTDQGSAERIATSYGPRGRIDVFRSSLFHDIPFLSTGTAPPAMDALLIDGHHAGSLLRIDKAGEAEALDRTLMAAPYSLLDEQPCVALLGETSGLNAWLALRRDASAVHWVQPNRTLLRTLRGPMGETAGAALQHPAVRVEPEHPRHYIERTDRAFDLIQLVTLQQVAAGGGMGGLAEDYLVTTQGLGACLDRLSRDGLLSVCRGIQTPPRDSVKLLATFIAALKQRGVDHPEDHIVVFRDFLGVCTLVRPRPWTEREIEAVRDLCDRRQLTPVWHTGVQDSQLNQPDALPGPEGHPGDWYHYAATQLFSEHAARFIEQYDFDIRPPTDDRPFFADFSKLSTIPKMRAVYGPMWLTRVELAMLFVLAALMLVGIAGACGTVLPLAIWARAGPRRGKAATIGYFAAIGLGFLMVEMTWLSRLTHLIGDPLIAASTTIAGFLLLAGIGSVTADRLPGDGRVAVPLAAGLVVALVPLELTLFGPTAQMVGGWSTAGRCVAALGLIAPLAMAMGFLMPLGLRRLDGAAKPLVPWAWGINGFASVLATPATMALGMSFGFSYAAMIAMGLYAAAGLLIHRLPTLEQ